MTEIITLKQLTEIQGMVFPPEVHEIVQDLITDNVRLRGVIQKTISRSLAIEQINRKISSKNKKALGGG